MRTTLAALMLWCAALGAPAARAQTRAGGEGFDFLLIDADARAAAMAGAMTAAATGPDALLYNPAGLAFARRHEVAFTHNQYVNDLYQDHLSLSLRQGFGASLNFIALDSIPRTTLNQPGGTGQNFGVTDMAIAFGWGREVWEGINIGAAGKYLRETIDVYNANAVAFDAGVRYDAPQAPGLSLGLAVQHVGPSYTLNRESTKLPITVRGGAAYAFPAFGLENLIAFDVYRARADKFRPALGLETTVAKMVSVRTGFTTRNETDIGLTAGVGFKWKDLRLDYAVVPQGDLGINHRITMAFRWGREGEKRPLLGWKAQKAAGSSAEAAPAPEALTPEARAALDQVSLGDAAMAEGRFQAAEAYYMEAIRAATKNGLPGGATARAYLGMGRCLMEKKDYAYAERFFTKALELDPSLKPDIDAELRRKP